MVAVIRFISLAAAIVAFSSLSGCNSQNAHESGGHDHGEHGHGAHAASHAAHDHGHGHNHGDEGPHGGHLIELGHNHAYHAELVKVDSVEVDSVEVDSVESVLVYILDTHMDEFPIAQERIILNITIAGESNAYPLAAVESGDSGGHSRFESLDKQLFQALERHAKLTGKLRVTIHGVPYVGRIARNIHAHDHSGQTR